ncbi:hypothetical protein B0A48_10177 [Cryoendolithus antarcticus]|uniref:Uncharacterized protein n=1 Tax=Cryoendolithus antarcticus TaxID=1507870 RepID=A0A1V8SWI5_9PEZI|nr:hypothetical protein B0A48_10177 [Cryoendolithus antarcticus]
MQNHAEQTAYQHPLYANADPNALEPPSSAVDQRTSQRQQTSFSPPLARSVHAAQAVPQVHPVPAPVTSDYTNLASQVAGLDSDSEPELEVNPLRVQGQYTTTLPLLPSVVNASTAQKRGLEAGEAEGGKDGTVVETRPCEVM